MHADEIPVDVGLVRRLLRSQFPQWNDLTLAPLNSAGVDNFAFRLGDHFLLRLPRRESCVAAMRKEQVWLPHLTGRLPCAIPEIAGIGVASEDYPYPWTVYRWIEGETFTADAIRDWRALAEALAKLLIALQQVDAAGGPAPGAHNFGRGAPLRARDKVTRRAIASLDVADSSALLAAWESGLDAPAWSSPPRWIHGDLHGQNLLLRGGRLVAAIDFGCAGVGDPACDLTAAWRLLPRAARHVFRDTLGVDDATWARGRAWALSISLLELAYYRGTAPTLTAIATRTVAEVLADTG